MCDMHTKRQRLRNKMIAVMTPDRKKMIKTIKFYEETMIAANFHKKTYAEALEYVKNDPKVIYDEFIGGATYSGCDKKYLRYNTI